MNKINFTNLPSTTTPINANNLNALQDNAEDAIDEVSKMGEYSTTETKIGTWTDGKPLYRKVFTVNSPTFNSAVNHNIPNIKIIVDVDIMLAENVTFLKKLPVVYQDGGSINPRFCASLYAITPTTYWLVAGSYYIENISTISVTFIVTYTKTTD